MEWSFWMAGLFLLGLGIGHSLGVQVYQARESARLETLAPTPSSVPPVGSDAPLTAEATRAEAARTGLVGRIRIERLGLDAIVAEGEDDATLDRAVGHIPGTALPGELGNVCLAGHRDSFFRGLKDIRRSDVIELVTPDGAFDYVVESIRIVNPRRIDVLRPTDEATLTLVTCYPFSYIGRAPGRFVVKAKRAPAGNSVERSLASESHDHLLPPRTRAGATEQQDT
jgi:sortase A